MTACVSPNRLYAVLLSKRVFAKPVIEVMTQVICIQEKTFFACNFAG